MFVWEKSNSSYFIHVAPDFKMKAVRGKNCLKGLSLIEYNKSETILIKMVNHTE